MKLVQQVILNRNTLFIFSVVCGLFFPHFAIPLKSFILFILGFMMTFSLTGLEMGAKIHFKEIIIPAIGTILLNYLILSGILILAAKIFIRDPDFYSGFILLAASPPGAAVIPFAFLFQGNVRYAVFGTLGAYLFLLIWVPFILQTFTHTTGIILGNVIELMIFIILIPFFISRFIIIKPFKKMTFNIRGKVVNLCFALIIYVVIGSNQHLLFLESNQLIKLFLILFLCTFGLSIIYEVVGRNLFPFTGYGTIVTHMMMISIKNSGFAIALALTFYGDKAAIPTLLNGIAVLLNLFIVSIRFSHKQTQN